MRNAETGVAVKRNDVYKMAEANKAFARYATKNKKFSSLTF